MEAMERRLRKSTKKARRHKTWFGGPKNHNDPQSRTRLTSCQLRNCTESTCFRFKDEPVLVIEKLDLVSADSVKLLAPTAKLLQFLPSEEEFPVPIPKKRGRRQAISISLINTATSPLMVVSFVEKEGEFLGLEIPKEVGQNLSLVCWIL
jgi:hypothetical protein